MDWKKIGKALLFPHAAFLLVLTPLSALLSVWSALTFGARSPSAAVSYGFAAYMLTVWCFRIPDLIRFCRICKIRNSYARRWLDDPALRIKVSLYGVLLWNVLYALLHFALGLWHRSFWYGSLGTYYVFLGWMRFFLVRHMRRHLPGERPEAEWRKYRACGIWFLMMNLALASMVFFMVYWDRTFHHHPVTAITVAAFTFASFVLAVVNAVKYRKYNNPVYSASNAIGLASAAVSMLTLESTLLTAFGDGTMDLTARRILLGCSGGAICVFIIVMALFMIVRSSRKIKQIRLSEE